MGGAEELKRRILEEADRLAIKYRAEAELAAKLIDYVKHLIDLCDTYERYKEIYEKEVHERDVQKLIGFAREVCYGG